MRIRRYFTKAFSAAARGFVLVEMSDSAAPPMAVDACVPNLAYRWWLPIKGAHRGGVTHLDEYLLLDVKRYEAHRDILKRGGDIKELAYFARPVYNCTTGAAAGHLAETITTNE